MPTCIMLNLSEVLYTKYNYIYFQANETTHEIFNQQQAQNSTLGLMAVLTACCFSSLACVYYEMIVKTGNQTSIVIRNLQLGNPLIYFNLFFFLLHKFNAFLSTEH